MISVLRKFRSPLCDVNVFRAADVDSDHHRHLLKSKIKSKLKRYKTSYKHENQYNVGYPRNEEAIYGILHNIISCNSSVGVLSIEGY